MEPLLSLKREHPTELTQCIFFQEDASEKLLAAKEQGLSALNKCVCQRQKLRDPQNRAATDRIVSVFTSEQTHLLIWHKSFYSSYTSKERISRLKKSEQGLSDHEKSSHPSTSAAELLTTPASRLRSSSSPMNWEACMFCQNVVANTKLSSVTTMKTSQRILEAAKFDQCLHVKMAGVSDLIASEGKYHPNCYKKFLRITFSAKEKSQQTYLVMQWLIDELKLAANKSHVLEMSEVWNRYCVLSEKAGVEVPQSFMSRRDSFKETLEPHMSDIYKFIFMSNRTIDDRITLLVPVKFGHIPIGKLADENDESFPMPVYQPTEDSFLNMVHVALKLRADILAQPAYFGFNITQEEAISCIPDSVYTFVRLIMGRQNLLEDDPEERKQDVTQKYSKVQELVMSMAQDLVYNVSGGKHWTPKHVGMASTLLQLHLKDFINLLICSLPKLSQIMQYILLINELAMLKSSTFV